MALLTKWPQSRQKHDTIRGKGGEGMQLEISHGNNRGAGTGKSFSAEAGETAGSAIRV